MMRSIHRRPAFTIVEVLLALSLIVVLAAAIGTFLWSLADRREAIATAVRHQRAGDVLLQRLEDDLLTAIAGHDGGSGIKGSAMSLELLSRGVWLTPPTSDAGSASSIADLQRTVYSHAGSVITIQRSPIGGATTESDVLCDDVARLQFRYFDGSEWLDTFDAAQRNSLPVAIEVAVWFGPVPDVSGRADGRPPSESPSLEQADREESAEADPQPWPAPDRLRVVVVPDGPIAAWSEGGGQGRAP
jgi:type II secretory pathway component PulJ